jgi:hypothetical protein
LEEIFESAAAQAQRCCWPGFHLHKLKVRNPQPRRLKAWRR